MLPNYRQTAQNQARRAYQKTLRPGDRPFTESEVFGITSKQAEASREGGIFVGALAAMIGAGLLLSRTVKGGRR